MTLQVVDFRPHRRVLVQAFLQHEVDQFVYHFLPFAALSELDTSLPPTFRQEIEFNRRRRCLDSYQLSWAGENTLDGIAKFVTAFIQQNIWKRDVDALQFGTQRELRQLHLQLLRRDAIERACEADLAVFGDS